VKSRHQYPAVTQPWRQVLLCMDHNRHLNIQSETNTRQHRWKLWLWGFVSHKLSIYIINGIHFTHPQFSATEIPSHLPSKSFIHFNQVPTTTPIHPTQPTSVCTLTPPHPYTYLPIHLPIYLPTYLSTYIPLYLSTYLFVYRLTYLHTYLSTYLATICSHII
jgi:hypothetical protein